MHRSASDTTLYLSLSLSLSLSEESQNSVVNHCTVVNDTESANEPQAQTGRDGAQRCEFDSTSVHRQTPPSRQTEIPGQHFIHPDHAAKLRRPLDGT